MTKSSVDEAGIIELKQVDFSVYESEKKPERKFKSIKKKIDKDYEKREDLDCEMITIVLAHHQVSDDQERDPNIRTVMETNLIEFRDYMVREGYHLPQNSLSIPNVYSSWRGYNYGFYSCGVWLK